MQKKSTARESLVGASNICAGNLDKLGTSGLKRWQKRYFKLAAHYLSYWEVRSPMRLARVHPSHQRLRALGREILYRPEQVQGCPRYV